MNKISHSKTYIYSRIQVFIGLCMAICIILCSNDISTYADGEVGCRFGYFVNDEPRQANISNQILSLDEQIQYAFNYQPNTNNYSYTNLISVLNYYGLGSYITNWNVTTPQFYMNLYYYFGSVSYVGDCYGYILVLSKNSCYYENNPYNNANTDEDFLYCNLPFNKFLSFDLLFSKVILPTGRIASANLTDSYSSSSQYISSSVYGATVEDDYKHDFYTYNVNRPSNYSIFYPSSGARTYVDKFLGNAYYDYLILVLPFKDSITDNRLDKAYALYNCGIGSFYESFEIKPIFSQIAVYDFNNDIYRNNFKTSNYTFVSPNNRSSYGHLCQFYYADFNTLGSFYKVNSLDEPIYLSYPYTSTLPDYVVTPTPYPTWSWVTPTPIPSYMYATPTPFPTVILNPTLTPIGFFGDTDIHIDTGDLWGDIKGNLGIFNQWFATNPFPAFFAGVGDLIYSFNPLFKFLMVIPITALIAMVIGRLRRK